MIQLSLGRSGQPDPSIFAPVRRTGPIATISYEEEQRRQDEADTRRRRQMDAADVTLSAFSDYMHSSAGNPRQFENCLRLLKPIREYLGIRRPSGASNDS
jgi:hypothetical protein